VIDVENPTEWQTNLKKKKQIKANKSIEKAKENAKKPSDAD
jgi:hypothetical protein